MATNVDLVSKTENGCAICMNGWRFPIKMLECGHSFCQWCLIGYRRGNRSISYSYMPCPTCRTEVRARNVDKMATNWALQQIVERLGLVNTDEDSMTASCCDTEESDDEHLLPRRRRNTYVYMDDTDSSMESNHLIHISTWPSMSSFLRSAANYSLQSQVTSDSGSHGDNDWAPTEVHDPLTIVDRFQVLGANSETEEDNNDSAFNLNVDLEEMDSNPTDLANTTDNASISLD